MAKKKAKPAPPADNKNRIPRKEPYDSDRMANVVERLREQAGRLSQLARTLDDADIDEVVIDGHAMLLRGLNQIDNFADNAARAVREARTMKFG
ncbi:hypothetical protein DTL42_24955 [Bremerella cremea]|uniref:Uncharacterized protein n=1 Tax=Bremerella cremea TaxID=1031537 RepID=A0A368KJ77_9BACT|nr:hypothetical protein [Bremerella cremea]RCS40623.1 hypothetical protein DTL42_24955 [Bremerella cremea]